MRSLNLLAILFPGLALAHGAHPPVDAALHPIVHGVVVAAVAVLTILASRWMLGARAKRIKD
jgi:hypothetical protein